MLMKKNYLSPVLTIVHISPATILAGSTGATIPGAGWGNAKESLEFNDEEELIL